MNGKLDLTSLRRWSLSTSALAAISIAFIPTAASADCLPSADGLTVICTTTAPNGYTAGVNNPTVNGVTIFVQNATVVGGGTSNPLLSVGTASAINNEGTITATAGGTAAALGGGGTFTDAFTATGAVTGDITFAATDGTNVNTLNNASPTGITGNVTSAGDLNVNNTGLLTGNINSSGNTTIVNGTGGAIMGDITLGSGNDTIENTGTISGNVNMGAGTNTFDASNGSELPGGSLTADPSGTSTLNLLGTTDETVNIPVTNFTDINVNTTASWTLGNAVTVTDAVNVIAGTLKVPDADFLGANTVVNDAEVEFTGTTAGTYSGNMSGTGEVVVDTGAAVTTFSGANTYSGGTHIDAGTLSVTGGAALLDTGDVYIATGGTLDVAQTQTIGGLFDDPGAGGLVTLSGGDLVINDGAFSGNISGANGIEKIGTGTLVLSGTNTFAGPAIVTDGTLEISGGAAIGDMTQVEVDATETTSGTFQVDTAETIGSLTGNGGSVVLDAALTTGNDNTDTTYSGVISGTGALVKIGTGTFTLAGANTYSGGTTIVAGTLAGDTTSLQGDIVDDAGATLLFNQDDDGTYSGAISGAGTLDKEGAGVLTLAGDNSASTGPITIGAGTIAISAANNIGTGPITMTGSTLETDGALTLANAITLGTGGGTFAVNADTTLSGVIGGAGGLTKTGDANLTLGGANTYSGGTLVSNGTLTGTTTSLQGDIVNNATLVFDQPAGGTYAGDLSGTGNIVFAGAGNVTFTGTNTDSGPVDIQAGTVTTTGTGISDASDVTVETGATLATSGDEVIGSLSGGGDVTAGGTSLTTGGNNNSTTFSGAFSNGELIKTGTGTMTLTGASTPDGGLTVEGGGLTIASTGSVDTGAAFTTVSNSVLTVDGTLTTAELDANTGSDIEIDTAGTVTGPIMANSGGLVRVNGTATGDVAVNAGGTLAGAGTINGNVTNSGTVSPGNSPGIITVNGSYTQTAAGTLFAEITADPTPGTGYDQVHVTGAPGTAALAGTLEVAPTTGLYVAGATYDVVRADGGITGTFATVSGNVVSPFITFTPTGVVATTGTEEVYRLTVTRTNYAVGIQPGATPNQIATANGFQNLVPGAAGDTATLVTGVDNMTAAQARNFFDEASPEPYGAYATALTDQGELFTRQVGLHMHNGTSPGSDSATIWGHGYYSWGSGSNDSYRYGSDQNVGGGVIGVDFNADAFTFGGAFGYSSGDVTYQLGNSNGHDNSWQIGGYASWMDPAGGFDADLQLAYIDGHFSAVRGIDVGTILRVANAKFDGDMFKVVGTVGYNTSLMDLSLRPFIGVDYSSGNTNSFTEHGAGSADLTVGEIDADKTNLMVGVDLTPAPMVEGLSPYGRLAYLYDVNGNRRPISAFFAGDPTSAFTVQGVRPSQSEFDIDAGLSYAFAPGASAFVGYQGSLRGDLNQNGVVAGITINFGQEAAPPPPAPMAPPPPPPPPPAPVKTFIVFFDFNQSDLTAKAQEIVAEAVRVVKANGYVKVLVTGHTDTVGSDSYNQALSVRRAETVKSEMQREGVDGSGIEISGKSFHDPLVPTGPDTREPQNRRAVIDLGG